MDLHLRWEIQRQSSRSGHTSQTDLLLSLAATNATSIVGRVLPLMLAQYVGPINIATSFALISAIMMFVWTRANGTAAVLAFDILYGVSSGMFVLPPQVSSS
jgi:nitrate/nitrite transporter NarK